MQPHLIIPIAQNVGDQCFNQRNHCHILLQKNGSFYSVDKNSDAVFGNSWLCLLDGLCDGYHRAHTTMCKQLFFRIKRCEPVIDSPARLLLFFDELAIAHNQTILID